MATLDQVIEEVKQLTPEERLRLIRLIVDTLTPSTPPAHQKMRRGQFQGERMSTEEDFRIAEWREPDPEGWYGN